METTRKAWIRPQVFVLGAEGTEGYKEKGTKETLFHLPPQVIHITISDISIPGSQNLAYGYQS